MIRIDDGPRRAIFIIMSLSCYGLFKQIGLVYHGQCNQFCLRRLCTNKYVELPVEISNHFRLKILLSHSWNIYQWFGELYALMNKFMI